MKKAVILSVVEPVSYSLDRSIAWTLVSSLKARQKINLLSQSDGSAGTVTGLVPLLQPIRIVISGQPAFLLAMRAFLDVTPEFKDTYGSAYKLAAPHGGVLATISSGTFVSGLANPYVLVAPQLTGLASADVLELNKYINFLASTLWPKEPVNWTTHRLHLAANGQFMTVREMALSGIQTGIPVFAGAPLKLTAGAKPVGAGFRQWKGAGALKTSRLAVASGSSCASSASTDSGGTGSGGTSDSSGGAGGSSGGGGGGSGGGNSFSSSW